MVRSPRTSPSSQPAAFCPRPHPSRRSTLGKTIPSAKRSQPRTRAAQIRWLSTCLPPPHRCCELLSSTHSLCPLDILQALQTSDIGWLQRHYREASTSGRRCYRRVPAGPPPPLPSK